MVSTIVSVRNPHNTILIGKVKDDGFQISARRQDKKKNMSELLKELVAGFEGSNAGGHVPAAGARILLKDKEEFKKRVEGLG
jgi:single-stranded DNA-specific DHH superfamily exonuclease